MSPEWFELQRKRTIAELLYAEYQRLQAKTEEAFRLSREAFEGVSQAQAAWERATERVS